MPGRRARLRPPTTLLCKLFDSNEQPPNDIQTSFSGVRHGFMPPQLETKQNILIPHKCPGKTNFNTQCPMGGRGSDRQQRWYVNCLTLMSNRQMMATYHQIEIRWMALMADGVTNIC